MYIALLNKRIFVWMTRQMSTCFYVKDMRVHTIINSTGFPRNPWHDEKQPGVSLKLGVCKQARIKLQDAFRGRGQQAIIKSEASEMNEASQLNH